MSKGTKKKRLGEEGNEGCEIMEQAMETFMWYSNGFLRTDICLLADISVGALMMTLGLKQQSPTRIRHTLALQCIL